MPLSKIQSEILRLIASHRDPESYVAGATPLNRVAPRYSDDIDVFQDREERVAAAALEDTNSLAIEGYEVIWLRQLPLIYTAEVSKGNESTRLEWVVDSDYRFFPTVKDDAFGYVLHPVDLGMNKVMAAAGRHEVRDLVDLLTVHETILPLGALIWAVVERSPGFTPEGLIAEIRRNLHYPLAEWRSLIVTEPIDPVETSTRLRKALDEAEVLVARLPTRQMGLLYLAGGEVVQPDPDRLDMYETHAAQRRGHWPTSPEITAAMLARLSNHPDS